MERRSEARRERRAAAQGSRSAGSSTREGAGPPTTTDREALVLAIAIGALCAALYVPTLAPTLAGGDSGELTTAARTLGVAHPPGYPLFTLLGRAFCSIPHGSIAWRVNLLSAVCGALGAVLLLLAVRQWTGDGAAGFAAGGLFAFSPLAWRYALVAEVFALNALFVSALLYLAARYGKDRSRRTAYAFFFTFALGLSNHHTLLFVGAPIGAWVLWTGRSDLWKPRPIVAILLLSLAGLAPYLYLPIAASQHRINSWGEAETLGGLLHHVLRRDYGTFQALAGEPAGGSTLRQNLRAYAADLPGEVLYVGVAAAAWGLLCALRRERLSGLAGATLASALLYLILFQTLLNLPIDRPLFLDVQTRFWILPNILVALWAGAGLADLRSRAGRLTAAGTGRSLAYGAAAALVAAQIAVNYRTEDQSRNRLLHQFGRAALEPLPPGTLLLTMGDLYINSIRYLQECEGVRKDVKVIDLEAIKTDWMRRLVERHYPDVRLPPGRYRPEPPSQPGLSYEVADIFAANVDRVPVYVNSIRRQSQMRWEGYDVIPLGFLFRVVRAGSPFDAGAYLEAGARAFRPLAPTAFGPEIRPGSWEAAVRDAYSNGQERFVQRLLQQAAGRADEDLILRAALRAAREILQVNPDPPPHGYKNLGIICQRLLRTDPGLEEEMIRAWEIYVGSGPPGDPDLSRIRDLLREANERRARQSRR